MPEALPNNMQDPATSPTERPASPVQGKAPAWGDPADYLAASDPPAFPAPVRDAPPRLLLESSQRSGMTNTAERIGSAAGTAQRQMRRGLELVRRSPRRAAVSPASSSAPRTAAWGEADVAGPRRPATPRINEWAELAGARFQKLRRELSMALARSREQVQRIAEDHPLETIAAVAAACFAAGVALRIRRPHRG